MTARMESVYSKMATELTCKLERAENIAITTDDWTALTTESYLTIPCHCVAEGKMGTQCCTTDTGDGGTPYSEKLSRAPESSHTGMGSCR